MPLSRGRYRGHDFNRMVCLFTMLNGEETVNCAVSWTLMDDLERARGTRAHERDTQFERLRDVIETIASRKFFSIPDGEKPDEILITSRDR